jgi:hypothetical protein
MGVGGWKIGQRKHVFIKEHRERYRHSFMEHASTIALMKRIVSKEHTFFRSKLVLVFIVRPYIRSKKT